MCSWNGFLRGWRKSIRSVKEPRLPRLWRVASRNHSLKLEAEGR